MDNYEKLGAFYLGRHHDLARREDEGGLLLYDSKDLVTHAVCVGMTGSGKTGLGVGLLEEAAIDGIPAIIIDPKGDMGNLLLNFPNLEASDFQPWVNEDDARRREMSVADYAHGQAELWRNGLESWGQDGERIRRLRDAAEFAIYTPGSEAGLPVSILASFAAPHPAVLEDEDLFRERVASTATSLLGLLGIDADPIQSREHILLSTLLDSLWRQGSAVDLGSLIQAIQKPPVQRVGVMDLDSFFPEKDRFKFAMRINNLLAAPSFQGWMKGEPLDVGGLLHTAEGKPRHAIFSIAHLSEPERMFFVSLLLNQTLSWMRSRPGTTSLRALLYMDEIFGYMPPVAEPPSKRPLLTLLKQARAYGLGVVLATQNPVDLDYKGLSNTGTWFIGRMQTERDKARILDGLEGVSAEGGGALDRGEMDKMISSLGKRVFLLHNVHEDGPAVFRTRWVLSYLRGPLTRQQIKRLMRNRRGEVGPAVDELSETAATETPVTAPRIPAADKPSPRPVLSAGIRELFVSDGGGGASYEPHVIGLAEVHYVDSRTKKEVHRDEISWLVPLGEELLDLDWEDAEASQWDERDLEREPREGLGFAALPSAAGKARSYATWKKALSDHLYRSSSCDLMRSPTFKLVSEPGETERDFRIRLGEMAREKRDAEIAKLRKRHVSKTTTLEERLRKARQRVEVEKEQASGQKLKNAISLGVTLLGALTGRKGLSSTTLSRAGTAVRGFGRSGKEKQDIDRAEETVEAVAIQIEELNERLAAEIDQIEERFDPLAEELEDKALRPRRSDVEIELVALVWVAR